MQKILTGFVLAGALTAPLFVASPATAGTCGAVYAGMLAPVRPATCVYQGDRIAQQWASYDGPAVIAPQDTYTPSPTVGVYVRPERVVAVERDVVERDVVVRDSGRIVGPMRKGKSKGKVEVVKARAVVRIYNPQRMDIQLYRQ